MIKHAIIAIAIQAIAVGAAYWLGRPLWLGLWMGAIFPSGFFWGREISQNEYRWMKANGTNRATSPWYIGLLPSSWHRKAVTDALVPTIAVVAIAWVGFP